MDKEVANVLDNLIGLQECLEVGEDWCSVAIVAGAIELIQDLRSRMNDLRLREGDDGNWW